jgi:TRAP-type C4-dicarboxylate transport system substrate-binding protein
VRILADRLHYPEGTVTGPNGSVLLVEIAPQTPTPVECEIHADCEDGAHSTLPNGTHHDVAENLMRTDHVYGATRNQRTFKAFDPAIQTAIREAGRQATVYNPARVQHGAADDIGKLNKTGVTIPTREVGSFRVAVEPPNEACAANLGDKAQEHLSKATFRQ